jgi:hypothetical protein
MPLSDFFAAGGSSADSARSMLVGAYAGGDLYCYFPMPFADGATVALANTDVAGTAAVEVEYAVRRRGRGPVRTSGLFGAALTVVDHSAVGRDVVVLDLDGRGRWVGLFAEVGSVSRDHRAYLEGDERVYVDGMASPLQHGTGVEDFFGGGYYFRVHDLHPVPFRHPLHGMVYDRPTGAGSGSTAMYRLMLTDAVPFRSGIRVGLEGGPENDVPIRVRAVAYYYVVATRSGSRSRRGETGR